MIVLGGWGTIHPVGHYIVLVAMVDKIWPISTPYTTENELIEELVRTKASEVRESLVSFVIHYKPCLV